MQLETFKTIIKFLKEQQRRSDISYSVKIDVVEFTDPLYQIIDLLVKEIYGPEGYSWFTWFCYDSNFGGRDWSKSPCFTRGKDGGIVPSKSRSKSQYGAFDLDGSPICFSEESTWEFLEKNYSKISDSLRSSKTENIEDILKFINRGDERKS